MKELDQLISDIVFLPEFSGRRVAFYSVRRHGEVQSEFGKWINLFQLQQTDFYVQQQALDILNSIKLMAMVSGAGEKRFRPEGKSGHALPGREVKRHLPALRLYCYRVSDSVVILLNGGLKTTNNPEHCINVARHFGFAHQFKQAFDAACIASQYQQPVIKVTERKIESPDESIEITAAAGPTL